MADEVIAKHDSKRKGSKLGLGGITVIDAALVEFGRSRLPSIVGVAEWCYEAIAEWVGGRFIQIFSKSYRHSAMPYSLRTN
jgi:hypothetical protein